LTVLIVDYGMGNLGSVRRAFEECGADTQVSDDPRDVAAASHIVLPGVGAFRDGMRNLHERGWIAPLCDAACGEGIPLLGICLGMQLLASRGFEGGEAEGLGLVAGEVRLLTPSGGMRVPHVGWNDVQVVGDAAMFHGLPDGSDFYFVHSYHFVPADVGVVCGTVDYGGEVVAAVTSGRVWGTQFHPEKSSRAGFRLLRNFITA